MPKTSASVFPPEVLKFIVGTDPLIVTRLWMTGCKNVQQKLQQLDVVVKLEVQQFHPFDKPAFPSIASKLPHLQELNVSFHLCAEETSVLPSHISSLPTTLEFLKLDIPVAFPAFSSAMNQDPRLFPNLKSLYVRARAGETELPAAWPSKLEILTIAGAQGAILFLQTLPPLLISLSLECLTVYSEGPQFPPSITFLELTFQRAPRFDFSASLPNNLAHLIINNPVSPEDIESWTSLPTALRTLKLLAPNVLLQTVSLLPRQLTSLTTSQVDMMIQAPHLLALPPDLEYLEFVDSECGIPPFFVSFFPPNLKSASPLNIHTLPLIRPPLEHFSVVSCDHLTRFNLNLNPLPISAMDVPVSRLTVLGLTFDAAQMLPKVSELTLRPLRFSLDSLIMSSLQVLPHTITTLKIEGHDLSDKEDGWIAHLPPKLTTLVVSSPEPFSATQSGFELLPKTLTHLEAQKVSKLHNDFFQIIPQGLKTLKLDLFRPNADNFTGFTQLASLETLELTSMQEDIPISDVLCSLPNSLTSAKVYYSSLCTCLSADDLKSLPPNLKFLWLPPVESTLTNIFRVTPKSLQTIVFGTKIRHRERSKRIKDVRLI